LALVVMMLAAVGVGRLSQRECAEQRSQHGTP
jgi:hypothetical protein